MDLYRHTNKHTNPMKYKRYYFGGLLGFTLIAYGIITGALETLRQSNAVLLNEALGTSIIVSVTGYHEAAIVGIPLIGGIIIGASAVWYYEKTKKEASKE